MAGGRVEKIILIFQDLDKLRDLADGKWHVGAEAEAAAKAGDVGAAGSESTTDLVKKLLHLRTDRCGRLCHRDRCRVAGTTLFNPVEGSEGLVVRPGDVRGIAKSRYLFGGTMWSVTTHVGGIEERETQPAGIAAGR